MEKHFATYEQSLTLKELGFSEPCLGFYDDISKYFYQIHSHASSNNDVKNITIAPLKSQVFEFFRGYRLSFIINDYMDDYEANIIEWTLSDDRIVHEFPNRFDSWEEAESACIDKLIEIVKNK